MISWCPAGMMESVLPSLPSVRPTQWPLLSVNAVVATRGGGVALVGAMVGVGCGVGNRGVAPVTVLRRHLSANRLADALQLAACVSKPRDVSQCASEVANHLFSAAHADEPRPTPPNTAGAAATGPPDRTSCHHFDECMAASDPSPYLARHVVDALGCDHVVGPAALYVARLFLEETAATCSGAQYDAQRPAVVALFHRLAKLCIVRHMFKVGAVVAACVALCVFFCFSKKALLVLFFQTKLCLLHVACRLPGRPGVRPSVVVGAVDA